MTDNKDLKASPPLQKIVIVGAGFAGVRAALDLAKKKIPNTSITLITNKPHFYYYPAMYRVATGSSPLEAEVPLRDIFGHIPAVTVIQDVIVDINIADKMVAGKQAQYSYDMIILALGSKPRPIPVPNIEDVSFNFLNMREALRMRHHIDRVFSEGVGLETSEQLHRLHFIIVGAGASGVEVAGELAAYTRHCANCHKLDQSLVTIDLIERNNRVLSRFSETVSEKVTRRLRMLGVNVFANRSLQGREDADSLLFDDMEMSSQTVIWTAGTEVNHFYNKLPANTQRDTVGRIKVTEQLELYPNSNIFIVGDAAATPFAGLAQTALFDGSFVSKVISARIKGRDEPEYKPKPVFHDIPVGSKWAVLQAPWFVVFGRAAWWMRYLIDIKFYLSLLPLRFAWRHIWSGRKHAIHQDED